MNAFAVHLSFEFRTGIRNRTLLLMNYLFPLGFFLMMGFIMPDLNPSFLPLMIPAMVVFAVLAATLLGLPEPLVNAREAGVFRSYKIMENIWENSMIAVSRSISFWCGQIRENWD